METVYYCPFCGTKLDESYDNMNRGELTGVGRLYCRRCKCVRVDIKVYFTEDEVEIGWNYQDKEML